MSRVLILYTNRGDIGKILKTKKTLPEDEARIYLAEILLALEDLHKRNIIFRDLKPENVVLDSEGHAILTDFGLSKEGVTDSSLTKTFCGSKAYLAPEIINRSGHNKSLDWYLFGLMTHEMLIGSHAYFSPDKDEFYENVRSASLTLPKTLSAEAKDFITRLLNRNPAKRLGAGSHGVKNIKSHPWFKMIDWDAAMKRELKPPKPILRSIEPMKIHADIFADSNREYKKVENWTIISDIDNNAEYHNL